MLATLVICNVNMSDAAELFGAPPPAGVTPAQTALCLRRGLVAFGVEEDGQLAGLSIAESRPRGVHILGMEGLTGACPYRKCHCGRHASYSCNIPGGELSAPKVPRFFRAVSLIQSWRVQ